MLTLLHNGALTYNTKVDKAFREPLDLLFWSTFLVNNYYGLHGFDHATNPIFLSSLHFLLPVHCNRQFHIKTGRVVFKKRFLRSVLYWGLHTRHTPHLQIRGDRVELHLTTSAPPSSYRDILWGLEHDTLGENLIRFPEVLFRGLDVLGPLLQSYRKFHNRVELLSDWTNPRPRGFHLVEDFVRPFQRTVQADHEFCNAIFDDLYSGCCYSYYLEGAPMDLWKSPHVSCYLPPENHLEGSLVQTQLAS
uniref:Silencing suppressor n=1 Tax=Cnidium polerovirus 1 TaxID=3019006 RepID=A0AA51X4J2_9VIRU|nr:MAG: putative silencing suppressor [Cnidium polerovirus 1]